MEYPVNTKVRVEKMGQGHVAIVEGHYALRPGELAGLKSDAAKLVAAAIAQDAKEAVIKQLAPKLTRKDK